jgi:hypothetical protein
LSNKGNNGRKIKKDRLKIFVSQTGRTVEKKNMTTELRKI